MPIWDEVISERDRRVIDVDAALAYLRARDGLGGGTGGAA